MPSGPSSRPKPERLVPPNGRSAPSPAGVLTVAMPTSSCSATLIARSSSGDQTAQLLAVGPHFRGHAGEYGRGEVSALTVVERAADVQRGTLRYRVLHLDQEVLRRLTGDHRAVGARGVIARLAR